MTFHIHGHGCHDFVNHDAMAGISCVQQLLDTLWPAQISVAFWVSWLLCISMSWLPWCLDFFYYVYIFHVAQNPSLTPKGSVPYYMKFK